MSVTEIPARVLRSTGGQFRLARIALGTENPFTRHRRVAAPIDTRWVCELELGTFRADTGDRFGRAHMELLESAIDQAGGEAGIFSAFDPHRRLPLGTGTGLGTAAVGYSDGATFSDGARFLGGAAFATTAAASARGSEYLSLAGLIASQPRAIAQGDMMAVTRNGEAYGFLHKAIATAPTDATGAATVRIAPRLREAVPAGATIRFRDPRGMFRLTADDAAAVTRSVADGSRARLSMVEVPEYWLCAL